MLQRSSVKASGSAAGQIARHRSPRGLSFSLGATGKSLKAESHLHHRLHSSISQSFRNTTTAEALAAGVRATVSLDGLQITRSNRKKASSARSSRLGVCCGSTRSLNHLTTVDIRARDSSSYFYCFQHSSVSFHLGPTIRSARAWKSTSAPSAVAEHGVSASGESKGALRSFCLTGEAFFCFLALIIRVKDGLSFKP